MSWFYLNLLFVLLIQIHCTPKMPVASITFLEVFKNSNQEELANIYFLEGQNEPSLIPQTDLIYGDQEDSLIAAASFYWSSSNAHSSNFDEKSKEQIFRIKESWGSFLKRKDCIFNLFDLKCCPKFATIFPSIRTDQELTDYSFGLLRENKNLIEKVGHFREKNGFNKDNKFEEEFLQNRLADIFMLYLKNSDMFGTTEFKNFGGSNFLQLVESEIEKILLNSKSVSKFSFISTKQMIDLLDIIGSPSQVCLHEWLDDSLVSLESECIAPLKKPNKIEFLVFQKDENLFVEIKLNSVDLKLSGNSMSFFKFKRWLRIIEMERHSLPCEFGNIRKSKHGSAKKKRLNDGLVVFGIIISVVMIFSKIWNNYKAKKEKIE